MVSRSPSLTTQPGTMHACQHIAGSEADQKGHCAALAHYTAQVRGEGAPHTQAELADRGQ